MRALVAAAGDARSIEPRLSGDFKYAPLSVMRGPREAGASADLQLAAARIREGLASDRSAARLHADGVARLMLGDAGGAVTALTEAAQGDPPPALSADLAAALIVRGTREDRAADFTAALDSLARIPGESAPPAAIFNKALALEKLNLREQAREAWREYLARDAQSGWAEEARRHLDDLSK
jgi:tetratricopeptide (TPR) repeat protein